MADENDVTTDEVTENEGSEESTDMRQKLHEANEEAKKYRKDKAALKKDFEETQKRLEKLEAEKLTDTEKKEKRIKELEEQLITINGDIKQKETDNLILKAVSGKNIVDIETATLLVQKELSSEEDITADIVSKVVDKVIKDKPFLVNQTQGASAGNFGKTNNEPANDPDQMLGEFLAS